MSLQPKLNTPSASRRVECAQSSIDKVNNHCKISGMTVTNELTTINSEKKCGNEEEPADNEIGKATTTTSFVSSPSTNTRDPPSITRSPSATPDGAVESDPAETRAITPIISRRLLRLPASLKGSNKSIQPPAQIFGSKTSIQLLEAWNPTPSTLTTHSTAPPTTVVPGSISRLDHPMAKPSTLPTSFSLLPTVLESPSKKRKHSLIDFDNVDDLDEYFDLFDKLQGNDLPLSSFQTPPKRPKLNETSRQHDEAGDLLIFDLDKSLPLAFPADPQLADDKDYERFAAPKAYFGPRALLAEEELSPVKSGIRKTINSDSSSRNHAYAGPSTALKEILDSPAGERAFDMLQKLDAVENTPIGSMKSAVDLGIQVEGDLLLELANWLREEGYDEPPKEDREKKARERELGRLITEGIAKKDASFFKKAGKILENAQRGETCDSRRKLDDYCAKHSVQGVTDRMQKAIICRVTLQRNPDTGEITYSNQPCHTAFTVFDGKGSSYSRHVQEIHLKCPKYASRNGRK